MHRWHNLLKKYLQQDSISSPNPLLAQNVMKKYLQQDSISSPNPSLAQSAEEISPTRLH